MMPLARVLLARGDSVAVLTEGSMAGLVEPEGITFLAAGLVHGIPLVVLPQGADHPRQAASVRRTNIGIPLDADEATPVAVAAAVTKCLNDSTIRANAARIAQEIATMPSPDEVAKILATRLDQ